MKPNRIFLLSPARCDGKRAAMVFNENARFPLAQKLRQPGGAPIGEVFSFLSGLYFRGKLAYSQRFASRSGGLPGAYVITSSRGLLPTQTPITLDELRAFGSVDIDAADERYRLPLEQHARQLLSELDHGSDVVLLGSVATGKYVDVLTRVFGQALHFPADFVGRGDMSRGGLMLRCVESGSELSYIRIDGAVRNGKRPPRLDRWPSRQVS